MGLRVFGLCCLGRCSLASVGRPRCQPAAPPAPLPPRPPPPPLARRPQGAIKPLCDLLSCSDARIVTVALEGLENILKVGGRWAGRLAH